MAKLRARRTLPLNNSSARRARMRSQRGAVLVEAALVLPLMLLIIVGTIEYGLLFTTYSTTTASTRSGARIAATAFGSTEGSVAGQQSVATQIALATSADLGVLNNSEPVGMVVYKVPVNSSDGAPTGGFPGDNMSGGCTADCIRFTWDPVQQEMVNPSGSWSVVDACGATVDSVGIFVQTKHDYLTGLFGKDHYVDGHTVMRLEPLPTDQCTGAIAG